MTEVTDINDGLTLYRKLIVHAHALLGNRSDAATAVQECLGTYARQSVLADPDVLESLLKDLTDRSRERQPAEPPPESEGIAQEIWSLPFQERACLSLQANFGLEFEAIGAVLGVSAEEASSIHAEATGKLRRSLSP